MSWPKTEPAWLEAWALWLLRGRIEARPNAPATIPEVGWQFERFVIWRQRGGYVNKRPGGLWPDPPQWVWSACQRVLAALKPAPPPDPWAAWHLPVLYVADPDEAVSTAGMAKTAGFGSVAVQLATATLDDVDAVRQAELVLHAWGIATTGDAARLIGLGAVGYQPQIEGNGQRDAAIARLAEGAHGTGPRGIVTTFAGLETPDQAGRVTPYIDATFVECYAAENPVAKDLRRMVWQAIQYGLPHPVPVVGLYDGATVADYYALPEFGKRFGVWRGLQMDAGAWSDVAKLTGAV